MVQHGGHMFTNDRVIGQIVSQTCQTCSQYRPIHPGESFRDAQQNRSIYFFAHTEFSSQLWPQYILYTIESRPQCLLESRIITPMLWNSCYSTCGKIIRI